MKCCFKEVFNSSPEFMLLQLKSLTAQSPKLLCSSKNPTLNSAADSESTLFFP